MSPRVSTSMVPGGLVLLGAMLAPPKHVVEFSAHSLVADWDGILCGDGRTCMLAKREHGTRRTTKRWTKVLEGATSPAPA